jgi:hypothetical protein
VGNNYLNLGPQVVVLPGTGKGTFGKSILTGIGKLPGGGVVSGDFNGDGTLDVAYTRFNDTQTGAGVAVALGNGDGTFQTPVFYPTVTGIPVTLGPLSIVAADFNDDGNLDIGVADASGTTVSVLLRTGCTP